VVARPCDVPYDPLDTSYFFEDTSRIQVVESSHPYDSSSFTVVPISIPSATELVVWFSPEVRRPFIISFLTFFNFAFADFLLFYAYLV